ncbi:hypothetical protein ACE6H2_012593 [Prunus campanulata]
MLAKVGRLRSSADKKEHTRPKETHERFPFPQALFCLFLCFSLCSAIISYTQMPIHFATTFTLCLDMYLSEKARPVDLYKGGGLGGEEESEREMMMEVVVANGSAPPHHHHQNQSESQHQQQMHQMIVGIGENNSSGGEATDRSALNLERQLDHDGDPLAITAADTVAVSGVPPWNWREGPGNGITIKLCLYDDSDRIVRTEEITLYTEDDFRDFLARRGLMGLRELSGYRRIDTLDELQSGAMYQGVRLLGD